MQEPRNDQDASRVASWFDPEMIAYALVGVLAVGLAARALSIWALGAWATGSRLLPAVVLATTVVASGATLIALRRRKRMLYLGVALATVGSVVFLLASVGFTLPRSWLE